MRNKFLFLFVEFFPKYDRTTKGGVWALRQIPLIEQLKVLFRGTTTIIGAVVLMLTLLFSLFTLDSSSLKAIYFIGKETPIMAKITAVIPQEGKNRVLYQYSMNEKTYPGNFYTTKDTYITGSYIEVEYANMNPKHSRLLGEKTSITVIGMGLVILIGILLMSMEFGQNIKMWVLIKWGKVTRTTLASKERGKNEQYTIIFRYKDQEGVIYEHIEKTTRPEQFNQHIVETVLYLPKRPKIAILGSKVPPDITLYDI